jgi:hypothetical protein
MVGELQPITMAAAIQLVKEVVAAVAAAAVTALLRKTRAAAVPAAVTVAAVPVAVVVATTHLLRTRATAAWVAPSAWQPVVVAAPPVTDMVAMVVMPAAPVRTVPVVLRSGRVGRPAAVRIPEPAEGPAHIMLIPAAPGGVAVAYTALRI